MKVNKTTDLASVPLNIPEMEIVSLLARVKFQKTTGFVEHGWEFTLCRATQHRRVATITTTFRSP
jgi:hypothetical protein